MRFPNVYGVDFSGAKQAGHNTWVAQAAAGGRRLKLLAVHPLSYHAPSPDRGPALAHLVRMVADSRDSLWGFDFPFAMPVEIVDGRAGFPDQLDWVRAWDADAYSFGLHCLGRAKKLKREWHIRRTTDLEMKAPFDCYHYRIIYQTFHGMRDVLLPLSKVRNTAILPFHYPRLAKASRVLLESCPGSFLKRHHLPHNNYKQPAGGPLTAKRRRTRRVILNALDQWIAIPPTLRSRMMRNPGGDALDAVLAAVSAHTSFAVADHDAIRRHARYKREGFIYC